MMIRRTDNRDDPRFRCWEIPVGPVESDEWCVTVAVVKAFAPKVGDLIPAVIRVTPPNGDPLYLSIDEADGLASLINRAVYFAEGEPA